MLHWLYERMLKQQIRDLPAHICFMITDEDFFSDPGKIYASAEWAREISRGCFEGSAESEFGQQNIEGLTYHISTHDIRLVLQYLPFIRKIGEIARLYIHYDSVQEEYGEGMHVTVAIGKSGKEEIIEALRKMADDETDPLSVDEGLISRYLTFKYTPDLVIKTGESHLTDFLIWQSVYSELYFTDINWKNMRKIDFLRVLRDYQSRMRRYGR